MNEQRTAHVRGPRGQAFADLVRGLAPEHILCVSLDISKYFHVVMIHNGLGEIVTPPFDIDIYQSGFDQLCQAIQRAKAATQAQVVLVGMEPTSHYFENLARHLLQQAQPVKLINSFAVKQNREQHLMRREKTDQIDVAAIGDLLRRGEGTPYHPATGIYLQVQQLDRVRLGKVKLAGILKNQIIGHLDRIFPGLLILDEAAQRRSAPLFNTDFWHCQTLQDLIRVCPNPHTLSTLTPKQLVQAFHAQHRRLGLVTAAKIIAQARKTLLPDAELAAIRCELLHHDLALLEAVQTHLTQLESRLAELVAHTPVSHLGQTQGPERRPSRQSGGRHRRSGQLHRCQPDLPSLWTGQWSQRFRQSPAQRQGQSHPQDRRCLSPPRADERRRDPHPASIGVGALQPAPSSHQAGGRGPRRYRAQNHRHPVGRPARSVFQYADHG